ncbi:hypothetical protein CAP39_06355 [Sphingomonas sp. IBVSS1]|nr:hypothetical protein CAP39_06355 [Sphingomonas sp. IBVSS1]
MIALVVASILSASQFAASVAAQSPRAAVQQLVAGGDWPRVMAGIRGGAADWIALAPELAAGADAAHGAELTAALAGALPRAPAEVLAVVDVRRGPVLGVQAVCGAPAAVAAAADVREALDLLPDVAAVGRTKALCLKELAQAASR